MGQSDDHLLSGDHLRAGISRGPVKSLLLSPIENQKARFLLSIPNVRPMRLDQVQSG